MSRLIEDGWNRGDPGVFEELVAPDFVRHGPGPVTEHGRSAIAGIRDLIEGMAPLEDGFSLWSVERLIAEGSYVVAMIRLEPWVQRILNATRVRHPSLKNFIKEQDVSAPLLILVFRIAGGKVAEQWEAFDLSRITTVGRSEPTEEERLYHDLASRVGTCAGTAWRLERLTAPAKTQQDEALARATKKEYLERRKELADLIEEIERRFGPTELLERVKGSTPGWDRVRHLFDAEPE